MLQLIILVNSQLLRFIDILRPVTCLEVLHLSGDYCITMRMDISSLTLNSSSTIWAYCS
jgi:hypothetical protein